MMNVRDEAEAIFHGKTDQEQMSIFSLLARRVLSQRKNEPLPVFDEQDRTVGYLVPGDSSAAWDAVVNNRIDVDEIRHRIDHPGEQLELDEFIARLKSP